VAEALHGLDATTPLPRSITVDHGKKFMSRAREEWAYRQRVPLAFTRPGKPMENRYIESFNGWLRGEWLNVQQFGLLADAREKIEAW